MLRTLARALAQQQARLLPSCSSLGVAAEQATSSSSAAAASSSSRACWQRLPSSWRGHTSSATDESGESISVTFKDEKDGTEKTVQVPMGKSLLEAAHENEIELEGACEGSLACSTCHVIVEDQEYYDKLPEPDDDENDMLDLAFGLTDTSRLGCQVKCQRFMDGIVLRIPSASADNRQA